MIGASAVILHGGQSLLVFGGYDVDGFYVNDLHLLDLGTISSACVACVVRVVCVV
jgi:hypothetical protein